jgi:hypothetical protein
MRSLSDRIPLSVQPMLGQYRAALAAAPDHALPDAIIPYIAGTLRRRLGHPRPGSGSRTPAVAARLSPLTPPPYSASIG